MLWLLPVLLSVSCGAKAGDPQPAGNAGSTGQASPIAIIRGDPAATDWLTLTVDARGLAVEDGTLFRLRMGHPERPPERLTDAVVVVEGGGFSLELPASNEPDLYKRRAGFLDVDGDGVCTIGVDPLYVDYRFIEADTTLMLSDSVPRPDTNLYFLRHDAAEECDALNMAWPAE